MIEAGSPLRLTVVVAARVAPPTLEQTLASVAAQRLSAGGEIELVIADGSERAELAPLAARFAGAHVHVPGGNLPALKGEALRRARGELIAILDPSDVAEPGWADDIVAALDQPGVCAVGGSVLLDGARSPGNVAAYLFEYGAFNPPIQAGVTDGDLPGNNVAYRRSELVEGCADLLASEGFKKPFFHERLRARGGRLVIEPAMRVRHLTQHSFLAFSRRRFHYARCFAAVRLRHAPRHRRALYRAFAPAVIPLLIVRHLRRAASHPENRRLLKGAGAALCGVCAAWGAGEWLGYWFGAGCSCQEHY